MSFPFEKLEIYKKALAFVGDVEKLCSELKGKVSIQYKANAKLS